MSTATENTVKSAAANAPVSCVLLDYDLEIPMNIRTLADFREWAYSNEFPEGGRIDFLGNRIEVDMSPEDLFCHGTAKMEIGTVLYLHVQHMNLGYVFSDSTRISSPLAELSAEPDIVFLSYETLKSDKTRLIPKASGEPGRFIEIEGAVDLVVEIISDSSVTKDTLRLPPAYFEAGVKELWLVDARVEDPRFQIHHRGKAEFQAATVDEDGFQSSDVLKRRYKFERLTSPGGHWKYDLKDAEV